jgi:hypothetical protein
LKKLCLFLKVPSQRGVAWFDLGQPFAVSGGLSGFGYLYFWSHH